MARCAHGSGPGERGVDLPVGEVELERADRGSGRGRVAAPRASPRPALGQHHRAPVARCQLRALASVTSPPPAAPTAGPCARRGGSCHDLQSPHAATLDVLGHAFEFPAGAGAGDVAADLHVLIVGVMRTGLAGLVAEAGRRPSRSTYAGPSAGICRQGAKDAKSTGDRSECGASRQSAPAKSTAALAVRGHIAADHEGGSSVQSLRACRRHSDEEARNATD